MAEKSTQYESAAAITTSDTVGFAECKAIYVGGAGNMVVVTADGRTATFTGVLAGTIYPIRATRINSTGLTATALVALY